MKGDDTLNPTALVLIEKKTHSRPSSKYSTSFSDIKIGPQPESASLKALNQVSQPNMQIKILKSLHVTAVITPSLLFIYLFIYF